MKKFTCLCVLIVAGSLAGSSVLAGDIIQVESQGRTILPPLLKSKLGVARAVGYARLPETVSYANELGSRAFCSLISFDQLTDKPRENLALGSTRFTSDRVVADKSATLWLQSLIKGLNQNRQVIYLSLVGAPPPYQQPTIQKPAAHPTPINIPATATLVRQWINLAMPSTIPVNWVIWNEPEHTLRGSNIVKAADDMAAIYRSYADNITTRNRFDGIGLASFMKASLQNMRDKPSQSFADYVFNDLSRSPSPPIDYVTLNNFHGKTFELIDRLQADLRGASMDQPLVLNQFAPSIIGSHPRYAGSIQAASHYVQALDDFVQTKSLASACFSFWAGSDRKALLRETSGGLIRSLPYEALSFYQRMPLWRVPIQSTANTSGFSLIASRDLDRFSMLILPRPEQPSGGLGPGRQGKTERQRERRALRQQERRQQRRQEAGSSEPGLAGGAAPSMLTVQLASLPDVVLNVRRLTAGQIGSSLDQIRTDRVGRLTLAISPNQIVMLSSGETKPTPPLLASIRTDLYIHRDAPEQGWASVDSINDGFVLALPTKLAVAHASATYAAKDVTSNLTIQLSSPEGSRGLVKGLECSAAVLQGLLESKPITLARWGNPLAADSILASRAFRDPSGSLPTINQWPLPDRNGTIQLSVPRPWKDMAAFRLHIGARGCQPGTQLQARVLR